MEFACILLCLYLFHYVCVDFIKFACFLSTRAFYKVCSHFLKFVRPILVCIPFIKFARVLCLTCRSFFHTGHRRKLRLKL